MKLLAEQSLGKIVSDNYKTASVLEKYKLDFCCGGKSTLADACERKKISVDEVSRDLEAVLASPNQALAFKDMGAPMLISYILLHHHFYIRQNLPLIQQHLDKVAFKHGDTFPYMKEVASLFSRLGCELLHHMEKEETILFPAIREIDDLKSAGKELSPSLIDITAPIAVMEQEHTLAGSLMEQIHLTTHSYEVPEKACTTFRISLMELKEFEDKLHEHVHLENNILFEKLKRMIS